jgi:Glucose-6-phosphate dehydrogenase subunit
VPTTSLRELERELAELRAASAEPGAPPRLRASVMTHIAWVPERWLEQATATLAGLAERHPSRTILLLPRPDDPSDELQGEVDLRCFVRGGEQREVCSEVITLRMCGQRAFAPASIVTPLLVSDLPVFLRWRGRPPFATDQFRQLVELVDRLIVDSAEWPDLPGAYEELDDVFEATATSDIAWRRTLPWRAALAAAWPELPDRVAGPPAEAALVAGWLRSRAGDEVAVERAEKLPYAEDLDPSDLLSAELEIFGREPIYEEAVRSAGRP